MKKTELERKIEREGERERERERERGRDRKRNQERKRGEGEWEKREKGVEGKKDKIHYDIGMNLETLLYFKYLLNLTKFG